MIWSFNPNTLIRAINKIIFGLYLFGILSLFYTPGFVSVIVIVAILDTIEVTY